MHVASVLESREQSRRRHVQPTPRVSCTFSGCTKTFSRSSNLTTHLKIHDVNREYPFQCSEALCGKKFTRRTDLRRHFNSVHAKARAFPCYFCTMSFARSDTRGR
ncbi:hypothetical protein QBC35DRAFT_392374 [Podospora australis]|uniref:C2H2-type domain-containing protein n=1 Tax=Podospora australis TaxID=1536484 RepID=A0AAN6WMM6_9PEZI|nr:hypothetical protein QBC35DRAFT_392374 [Podospora australis]